MATKTYKAILSEKLSKKSRSNRYVIVSIETGEILDDAQGYGYKTAQKAYAAYGYKNRTPQQKQKEKEIKNWLMQHKKFSKDLQYASFYAVKDSHGTEHLTSKDVQQIIEQREDIDKNHLPGTPAEILRVWQRM